MTTGYFCFCLELKPDILPTIFSVMLSVLFLKQYLRHAFTGRKKKKITNCIHALSYTFVQNVLTAICIITLGNVTKGGMIEELSLKEIKVTQELYFNASLFYSHIIDSILFSVIFTPTFTFLNFSRKEKKYYLLFVGKEFYSLYQNIYISLYPTQTIAKSFLAFSLHFLRCSIWELYSNINEIF